MADVAFIAGLVAPFVVFVIIVLAHRVVLRVRRMKEPWRRREFCRRMQLLRGARALDDEAFERLKSELEADRRADPEYRDVDRLW